MAAVALGLAQGCMSARAHAGRYASVDQPALEEDAVLTFAPEVPPPITRRRPAVVNVNLTTTEVNGVLMDGFDKPTTYTFWTFNGRVPGPFIRARVGDLLRIKLTNDAKSLMSHNIDLHSVTGPGGGAAITITPPGQTRTAQFQLLNPGLFVYHCAVPPVPHHVANGMYGLILVEPEEGLEPVDREFYVMQSEFYTVGPFGAEGLQAFSPEKAALEEPTYIVFNGRVGSMMDEHALKAKVGDNVRIFVGNGGPNCISSFHVIGEIFDKVYSEGSTSNPGTDIQTTLIPAGGSSVVEFHCEVPGTYTMVDHAIFRLDKGAVGMLKVEGDPAPHIYSDYKY